MVEQIKIFVQIVSYNKNTKSCGIFVSFKVSVYLKFGRALFNLSSLYFTLRFLSILCAQLTFNLHF